MQTHRTALKIAWRDFVKEFSPKTLATQQKLKKCECR